ncbi:bifunctional metallophosphatase/5'-nucleotidase [Paenisporosarcina antarctica]|uniref:Bifunctional metallophosphatase/5'-nucleotidase n=1 Tax=Paenisporosarcina antarctica TaxID=417367 RepID=A0A4P6ZW25_9BACL|nr:bifunctional UDP-sugar hydrolase/5'-nucleotidase [Paenisporosarcina antarctica]QBP40537.1 bifunctional metallophosphatase/5'-nucleotidase [Paenisporosarcina antarctica]
MIETIHFYHTNDLHSHFQHWPRIHELVTTRKKWHLEEGESSFTLDLGDHIDRSHIYTEGTLGKGNVDLLNKAQYDVATIGNNEGITLSHNELENLYLHAQFDVVVGNLIDQDGKIPKWLIPTTILTTIYGTKIGVTALTAEYTLFYSQLGWQVTEAFNALSNQLMELKKKTDIIICMSHLGINEDEIMAEKFPDIDVIFGAHTHHIFHEGKLINNSLLAAAGKYGYYVGHVTLDFDLETKLIAKKQAHLYDTNELKECANEDEFLEELANIGKANLMETAFIQNETFKKEWFKESALSTYFGKALTAFCQTDCALFNAGLFLSDLKEQEVSYFDIHKMMPHPINPCVIELTGEELKDIYLLSLNESWPNLEIKGLGFRGVVMGKMITHQFTVVDQVLFVQNRRIEPTEIVRLATIDMFTFGYFYPKFKESPKTYFMSDFIRDVLIVYGQKQHLI